MGCGHMARGPLGQVIGLGIGTWPIQVSARNRYLDVRGGKSFVPVAVAELEGCASASLRSRLSFCMVKGFSEEGSQPITRSKVER